MHVCKELIVSITEKSKCIVYSEDNQSHIGFNCTRCNAQLYSILFHYISHSSNKEQTCIARSVNIAVRCRCLSLYSNGSPNFTGK